MSPLSSSVSLPWLWSFKPNCLSFCLFCFHQTSCLFLKHFHFPSSFHPSLLLFKTTPSILSLILHFLLWWLCLPSEVKPVWWCFKGDMFVFSSSFLLLLPCLVSPTCLFLDFVIQKKGILFLPWFPSFTFLSLSSSLLYLSIFPPLSPSSLWSSSIIFVLL